MENRVIDPYHFLQEYADEVNEHLDKGHISDDNARELLIEMYRAYKEIKSKKIDKRISDRLENKLKEFLRS